MQATYLFGFLIFIQRYALIPKHKMAAPFCAFKNLTGFGF
jgi:hypothetical protein